MTATDTIPKGALVFITGSHDRLFGRQGYIREVLGAWTYVVGVQPRWGDEGYSAEVECQPRLWPGLVYGRSALTDTGQPI